MVQQPVHCARHPRTETTLRCGKCGTPICPKCLVYTPVGGRCRDCAQMRRLPIFELSPANYLAGAGAGLCVALVAGVIWSIVPGFISIWVPLLVGYAAGTIVSRAANRKRAVGLQIIAGLSVVLSYVVMRLFPLALALRDAGAGTPVTQYILSAAPRVLISGLLNPYLLVVLLLGIFLAYSSTR